MFMTRLPSAATADSRAAGCRAAAAMSSGTAPEAAMAAQAEGAVFLHFCDAAADSELGTFCMRLAGALALRNGLRAYVPSSAAAAAAACAHWLSVAPPVEEGDGGGGGGSGSDGDGDGDGDDGDSVGEHIRQPE